MVASTIRTHMLGAMSTVSHTAPRSIQTPPLTSPNSARGSWGTLLSLECLTQSKRISRVFFCKIFNHNGRRVKIGFLFFGSMASPFFFFYKGATVKWVVAYAVASTLNFFFFFDSKSNMNSSLLHAYSYCLFFSYLAWWTSRASSPSSCRHTSLPLRPPVHRLVIIFMMKRYM